MGISKNVGNIRWEDRSVLGSLELFSGTGGLALGLHNAGFQPYALIEWNQDS
jgi:hypothetical protein